MEEKMISKIGVDKITLNMMSVIDVDEEKLEHYNGAGTVEVNRKDIKGMQKKRLSSIHIIDNRRFSDLTLTTINLPGYNGSTLCGSMTFSPHHLKGNNLDNVSIEDIKCSLVDLSDYIRGEYGLTLDFRFVQIKSIEINVNIFTAHPFCDYSRVLQILCHELSERKRFGKLIMAMAVKNEKVPGEGIVESYVPELFLRRNNQMELVIYDKQAEAHTHDKIDLPYPLMRIEIRLLTAKKVESVFKEKRLSEITDEMVAGYFYKVISAVIEDGYGKWHLNSLSRLQNLLPEYQQKYKRKDWRGKLLLRLLAEENERFMPVLLDIRDLKDALGPDPHRHNNRLMKPFNDYAGSCEAFFRKDRDKFTEILSQIDAAYTNSLGAPPNGAGKSGKTAQTRGILKEQGEAPSLE